MLVQPPRPTRPFVRQRTATTLFAAILLPLVAAAQKPQVATPPTATNDAPTTASPPTIPAVLYSTHGDEKVHLLSLPELKPLHVYDAGAGAHELAISADGRYALGSAYGGPGKGHQPVDHRVFVLDLPSGKRSRMVDLGASKRPNDLAFVGATTTALARPRQRGARDEARRSRHPSSASQPAAQPSRSPSRSANARAGTTSMPPSTSARSPR